MREHERDKERLLHIIEAIENAQQYTKDMSLEMICQDKLCRHATAYNIQIIGEAVYKLTKDFKDAHPSTPWRMIEKMRHILVHDYFQININIFWSIVQDDLPILKEQVNEYITEFK